VKPCLTVRDALLNYSQTKDRFVLFDAYLPLSGTYGALYTSRTYMIKFFVRADNTGAICADVGGVVLYMTLENASPSGTMEVKLSPIDKPICKWSAMESTPFQLSIKCELNGVVYFIIPTSVDVLEGYTLQAREQQTSHIIFRVFNISPTITYPKTLDHFGSIHATHETVLRNRGWFKLRNSSGFLTMKKPATVSIGSEIADVQTAITTDMQFKVFAYWDMWEKNTKTFWANMETWSGLEQSNSRSPLLLHEGLEAPIGNYDYICVIGKQDSKYYLLNVQYTSGETKVVLHSFNYELSLRDELSIARFSIDLNARWDFQPVLTGTEGTYNISHKTQGTPLLTGGWQIVTL
jgi:hypothetical protein